MRNVLGVLDGIVNGRGAALRDAEERERLLGAGDLDDRLDIRVPTAPA